MKPRALRLDLSFPVVLFTPEGEIEGHCLNISESGLLATFSREPELWSHSTLRLHFGSESYTLPVRVARVADGCAGLSFCFRDDADRQRVRRIVAFAAAETQLTGRPLP